jgi:hypothetical protein
MSSKNYDNVDVGEAERDATKKSEKRAPQDRGEAAEQEQERIMGEAERDTTKKSEKRAPQDRGEAAEQEQERIVGEAER